MACEFCTCPFYSFCFLTVGAADAPVTGTVKPTTDMATQKNAQAVPKSPSSQPAAVSSDTTTPATPTKGIRI